MALKTSEIDFQMNTDATPNFIVPEVDKIFNKAKHRAKS